MERIFVDTSSLFALLSWNDKNYKSALGTWKALIERNAVMVTNNYVMVECFSLLQNRLGVEAVRELESKIVPLVQMDWIGEQQHRAIVQLVFSANRRQLSLVDCSSFETMRRLGIEKVFSFDAHFREQGFEVIP